MRRHAILLGCVLALVPASAEAAPADFRSTAQVWTELSGRPAPARPGTPVAVRTREEVAFDLDHATLRGGLPERGAFTVSIPTPEGTLERFRAVPSRVLAPALARRHPEIRTFTATGIDDERATAALDLTPLGFHASVRTERGFYYVEPRYRGDRSVYVSYFRDALVRRDAPLEEPGLEAARDLPAPARAPGDAVVRRLYRLALANDPSYAAYFGSANVEAAKATLVSRLNQVYMDDLAIQMQLVAGNGSLNFDTAAEFNGPGAPYNGVTATCDGAFITRNDQVIDSIIGSGAYDIGHIVGGSAFDGGGIAGLGVVGGANKGRGCTGLDTPEGDPFAIDYVAHEIGHQFNGSHTFDGTAGNCSGVNRDGASAVEPGSGSSIQAYAGICGADNLQPNSDPYFSQQSIDEIQGFVTSNASGTNEGFVVTTTANRSPVVTTPPAHTVPVRTPFTLTGSATDADGDPLVFLWEQDDPGGAAGQALFSDAKPDGPLFRVFSGPGPNAAAAAGNVRTFPDPAQIAGGNTNALTGACPAFSVECYSEFLPTTPRTLHFRLTARDRSPAGGGVSSANTTVTVAGLTPFRATAPTGPAALTGEATVPVTWDVAGTSAPPFNVANVRIAFSADGGLTFPYEVSASTANDGSETVTVPNVTTSLGRFEVEAIGSPFFDTTDGNLTVSPGPGATATPSGTPQSTSTPTPTPTTTPSVAPGATPARTPDYVIPTPTPTSTVASTPPVQEPTPPQTLPGLATLAPDLALVPRRLRPDGRGRIGLRVRCKPVTPGTPPARCRGRAAIERNGNVVAARSFGFGVERVGIVRVRLSAPVRRRLRRASVPARVRVTVGTRTATKRVRLKRIV